MVGERSQKKPHDSSKGLSIGGGPFSAMFAPKAKMKNSKKTLKRLWGYLRVQKT